MGMINCYNMLKNSGYSLQGYSQDTIIELLNKEIDESVEECEKLFTQLEIQYG